jgi:hypothetical protein
MSDFIFSLHYWTIPDGSHFPYSYIISTLNLFVANGADFVDPDINVKSEFWRTSGIPTNIYL